MRPSGISLATLILWLTACSPIDRAKECEAVGRVVNPALKIIAPLTERPWISGPAAVGRLTQIGNTYEFVGADLDSLKIEDRKLKPLVGELSRHFTQLGETATKLARGAAKNSASKLRRKKPQFERTAKKQEALVKRLNKLCHAK